jgi:hypothetical protein
MIFRLLLDWWDRRHPWPSLLEQATREAMRDEYEEEYEYGAGNPVHDHCWHLLNGGYTQWCCLCRHSMSVKT